MKWGIVILLLLGVVAAACAAVLVGAVKLDFFGFGNKAPQTVKVMVAARSLPAMQIITPDCIEKKVVPRSEALALLVAPTEKLAGEATSIGRVLRVAVVKDQILVESSFVPQGSAEELLAKLPDGMRAFTVNLRSGFPDRALLRPGGIVDIVSVTTLGRDRGGQTIASPLLNGIMVLAVQGESVINPSEPTKAGSANRNSRGLDVTLQVDNNQAAALQLAMTNGSIALICRNPSDKKAISMDTITLDEGRLISLTAWDLASMQTGGDPNETKQGVIPYAPVVPVPPKFLPPTG
ncbi:MAG TPA: Flp pilus assembly protein CpaB, partial [Phycisphaerales bacterium]|nr:Flp pilus assembly protein CpaB [Phycisphaerales bacterium]